MRFPIVFFDVDGTLLNSAKQVSPLTLRALETLHDTGVKLCIATGRPVKSARLAMQHLTKTKDPVCLPLDVIEIAALLRPTLLVS